LASGEGTTHLQWSVSSSPQTKSITETLNFSSMSLRKKMATVQTKEHLLKEWIHTAGEESSVKIWSSLVRWISPSSTDPSQIWATSASRMESTHKSWIKLTGNSIENYIYIIQASHESYDIGFPSPARFSVF
jgi:hypothetical protein